MLTAVAIYLSIGRPAIPILLSVLEIMNDLSLIRLRGNEGVIINFVIGDEERSLILYFVFAFTAFQL